MCITHGWHRAARASPYAAAASFRRAGAALAGTWHGRSPQVVKHYWRSPRQPQMRRQKMRRRMGDHGEVAGGVVGLRVGVRRVGGVSWCGREH